MQWVELRTERRTPRTTNYSQPLGSMTDADSNAHRIQLLLTAHIDDATWIPVSVHGEHQTVWIKAVQFEHPLHATRFTIELGEPLGLEYYERFMRDYRSKPATA
jgi:hypothetical protein